VCCSVLQCVTRKGTEEIGAGNMRVGVLQKGVGVLQCVAVCCSVLQCVAVCAGNVLVRVFVYVRVHISTYIHIAY